MTNSFYIILFIFISFSEKYIGETRGNRCFPNGMEGRKRGWQRGKNRLFLKELGSYFLINMSQGSIMAKVSYSLLRKIYR